MARVRVTLELKIPQACYWRNPRIENNHWQVFRTGAQCAEMKISRENVKIKTLQESRMLTPSGHKIIVNIVVLDCQQCNQCLKCQVSGHKIFRKS